MAAAWLPRRQSYRRRTTHCITLITLSSAVYRNRRVNHSVKYVCVVREYAVKFNTQDFSLPNSV